MKYLVIYFFIFSNRGVIGGLLDSFNGIYENIVKDYVTDVYTDVIEGYSIATIKVRFPFYPIL